MIQTYDGRQTWYPTPRFDPWACDCGAEVSGTLHTCPDCGLHDSERECEQ